MHITPVIKRCDLANPSRQANVQTKSPAHCLSLGVGLLLALALVPAVSAQAPEDTPLRLRQNQPLVGQLMVAMKSAAGRLKAGDPRLAQYERTDSEAMKLLRAGRTGEARRQLYRMLALLADREWTDRDEYWRSFVLRLDSTVCDPALPLIVRLGQIYPVTYVPQSRLKIRASFMAAPGPQPRRQPAKILMELGTFDAISPDLIDQPFAFAADLSGQPDGNYFVVLDLSEGDKPLTSLTAPVCLVRRFAAEREAVERRLAAIKDHESAKASVRYPFDFALKVNLGLVDSRGMNFTAAIQRSTEILAALEQGQDPLWQSVGNQKRHYWLQEAGEIMPYRLYVPQNYDGKRPYPLIVALHGNGGTEDTMIPGDNSLMIKLAEQNGYLVASPAGYRPDGGYGGRTEGEWDTSRVRASRFSEMDVMNVLRLVRSEYQIDENRIYLMGHSGGGGGTWRLGAKYADIWAALGPIASAAGGFSPDSLERMRHIPVIVCHGDADPVAPVSASRTLVARMKELGMTHKYCELPGGTHALVIPSLPHVFEFFNQHQRAAKP